MALQIKVFLFSLFPEWIRNWTVKFINLKIWLKGYGYNKIIFSWSIKLKIHVFETKRHEADDFGITKISEFDGKYVVVISLHCLLRKDAHKKVFSLEVGPLRGGGVFNPL